MTTIDTRTVGDSRAALAQRFVSRIEIDSRGCWLWTGQLDNYGYGKLYIGDRRKVLAHRYSYETFIGPIPDGLQLDHLCRVRSCVNPGHLEPVTIAENIARSPIAPATINAAKTHCPQGHEYTVANTYMRGTSRHCKTCRREYKRRWRARSTA